MCEQCSAKTKTYGEVIPHWWLVQATKDGNMMKKGDFGLVYLNDPDYVWPEELAPRKDPTWNLTDEQFNAMSKEEDDIWFEFQKYIDKLRKHLLSDPFTGYCLIKACEDAGWNGRKVKVFTDWLSHKMAETIERNPEAKEE